MSNWSLEESLFPIGTVFFWSGFLICFPGMFLAILGFCHPAKSRRYPVWGAVVNAAFALPGALYLVAFTLFPNIDWSGRPALLGNEAAWLRPLYLPLALAFSVVASALFVREINHENRLDGGESTPPSNRPPEPGSRGGP